MRPAVEFQKITRWYNGGMRTIQTYFLGIVIAAAIPATGAAQTVDSLSCPSCNTITAAQITVLQSQIAQQQLAQNIQQNLNAQQQNFALQQSLGQLRTQYELNQNAASLQNILLEDRMQLIRLQIRALQHVQRARGTKQSSTHAPRIHVSP